MNGRNPDAALQSGMRRETERIRGLLRTMLMYGKMGSMENDVQYAKVSLADAVREASIFYGREKATRKRGSCVKT